MYDFVGDIHGCHLELNRLLEKLGHPRSDRQLVFLGDLCDRGPASYLVLDQVERLCRLHSALMVVGNHDDRLRRYWRGNPVKISHGLNLTLENLASVQPDDQARIAAWLENLPWRLSLDGGKIIAVHAAQPLELQALDNKKARAAAIHGLSTGERDERGFMVRVDWSRDYHGPYVVHGHVARKEPYVNNGVYAIDTGCVYGNKLTALRYPEMELVSVPAQKTHYHDEKISP